MEAGQECPSHRHKFCNIVALPYQNSYQVKFRIGKDPEVQIAVKGLRAAIKTRNELFLENNIRPHHLFRKPLTMDCIQVKKGLETRSHNPYHRWQVTGYLLKDCQMRQKTISDPDLTIEHAKKSTLCYNAVAALYNGKTEEVFLQHLKSEQEELVPYIRNVFDRGRWNICVKELFGELVEGFYPSELPWSIPDIDWYADSKFLGYASKPNPFGSRVLMPGLIAGLYCKRSSHVTEADYIPTFKVAVGDGAERKYELFRIDQYSSLEATYRVAVKRYAAVNSLSDNEIQSMLDTVPPPEIFYIRYNELYRKGCDISICSLLNHLQIKHLNLDLIRA